MLRQSVDYLEQTVAIVTHDPVAASNADRIIFLADGKIVRESGQLTASQILDALK
jgi:putative ABC transport system ATP-binding protein